MISTIVGWICLFTLCQSKVIKVSSEGNVSIDCCKEGACLCGSLYEVLVNATNNTTISIISSVLLHKVVELSTRDNIKITGNNVNVNCNNSGIFTCSNCNNVIIEGITWDQCGHPNFTHAIGFKTVNNISIRNCTFQFSKACTVVLFQLPTGRVEVHNSRFLYNNVANSSQCMGIHASLAILDDDDKTRQKYNSLYYSRYNYDDYYHSYQSITISIIGSLFDHNDYDTHLQYDNVPSSATLLCFLTGQRLLEFSIENVTVSNTLGLGSSFFSLDIDDVSITFTNVTFLNNNNGGSIFRIRESWSSFFLRINSTSYENNNNGTLKLVTDDVYTGNITLYGLMIVGNKGTFVGKDQLVDSNSIGHGVGIFIVSNSHIELSHCNIKDNSGKKSIVYIDGKDDYYDNVVMIQSSNFTDNVGSALHVLDYHTVILYELMVVGNKGSKDQSVNSNSIGQGVGIFISNSHINLSHCNIKGNSGKKSIVYIDGKDDYYDNVAMIQSSNFTDNVGSALHVFGCNVELGDGVLFMNNSAERGAAIYIDKGSKATIREKLTIKFIKNTASYQGGSIFVDFPYCTGGIVITNLPETLNVSFTNNSAKLGGNSIYFNNPLCNYSEIGSPNSKFNYSQHISTAPDTLNLCSTQCNSTNTNCSLSNKYMLGQLISINAVVCDLFDNPSETVQFYIECTNCTNAYRLSSNRILVHNGPLEIIFLGDQDVVNDTNITLNFSLAFSSLYKPLTMTISLELSSCKSGYEFNENFEQCKCYQQKHNKKQKHIIQCQQDKAEIKYGYWFGIVSNTSRTVSLCPIHYCSFSEETNNGYYKLPEMLDEQCNENRKGVACGECKENYTLAYDSPDCIEEECKCSAGMTILVVSLTILYWIVVVATVFGLMQFKISLGYAYGLIYYYSIIDILLGHDLFISDEVFQLVAILSSFAKITPQFLGKLCFIKGLSGIDQQFIHYLHAISISVIIIVIVRAARYSSKIASFVSHCIIRVICLLILLSYTSLVSTSFQLLRPLYFDNKNGTYVYSSPSMKYFSGRHIPYGIIALLCECFFGIGLPLLLLLEPFLQRKVNFIKIKPLLDQYQQCYKDQYRWFAAYYLICRQVIIATVYFGNIIHGIAMYYLQTVCIVIVTIHVWIKPYKRKRLNVLDGIILLTMVLVVNLHSFTFPRKKTTAIIVILLIFPLLVSCLNINGKKIFSSFMKCMGIYKRIDSNQEDISNDRVFDPGAVEDEERDEEADSLNIEETIKTT